MNYSYLPWLLARKEVEKCRYCGPFSETEIKTAKSLNKNHICYAR